MLEAQLTGEWFAYTACGVEELMDVSWVVIVGVWMTVRALYCN